MGLAPLKGLFELSRSRPCGEEHVRQKTREAQVETDVMTQTPREQPRAWPFGSSFSPRMEGPALHPSLGKQSPGGPAGPREVSVAFVSGLRAQCGHRAKQG